MKVRRLYAARVPDAHHPARLAGVSGKVDNAVRDAHHGRSVRRTVVDAEMRAIRAVHRMQPSRRKSRGDPRVEWQRRLEKLAFQRATILVVPGDLSFAVECSHSCQPPAVIHEHGGLQFSVSDELAITRRALEKNLEAIAGLEI